MIKFTDEEFQRLTAYISEGYGIDLSKKRTLAECRMSLEMEKRQISSLTEFLSQMRADKTGRLAAALIDRLTTNYTFFLREQTHFDFLEQEILPQLSPAAASFQIWCAGCSTGEECYTLAMLLAAYRDHGGWLPPVRILATDISEQAMRVAMEARYPSKALEQLPEAWRRSYCRTDGTGFFTLRDDLRKMISFRKMNLMRPYAGHEQYDLVLCRNVMIYFNEAARKQLTQRLAGSLKKGGYLFIGHTELLPAEQTLLTCVRPAIYQKARRDGQEKGQRRVSGGIG